MSEPTTTTPETNAKLKRILKLDASALKNSACPRRHYLAVIEGWRSKVMNNDIEIGVAFHKFPAKIEELGNAGFGVGILDAMEYFRKTPMFVKEKKAYMTEHYLAKACQRWFQEMYKKDTATVIRANDGTPMVEIPFEFLYYSDDFLEVWICGTIDKVVKFQNGCLAIGDYKTTSSHNKQEFFQNFLLSVQLRLYLWAVWRMCKEAPTGSFFSTIKSISSIGMFIDGIFFNGVDTIDYKRSDVMFMKADKMAEFELMLEGDVQTLIALSKANTLPPPHGIMTDSCSKWGGCPFSAACASPDMISFKHILKNNFIQRPYDPLNFHGEN